MRLSKRDSIATGLVAVAVLLYTLWALEHSLPSMRGTRVTGTAILVLGFLASASAVVPSFERLLHGNKAYLAVTSLIGTVAAVAGVQMLVTASKASLAVVMVAMFVLWVISTVHHSLLEAHGGQERIAPPRHRSMHRPRML